MRFISSRSTNSPENQAELDTGSSEDGYDQESSPGENLLPKIVGSMEPPSKAFLLFFLLPDWLKLSHLKSRMECGFPNIFLRHICSTVAKTIGVTNYATSFGAKNVQKATFEASEMKLDPWNLTKTRGHSDVVFCLFLVVDIKRYRLSIISERLNK